MDSQASVSSLGSAMMPAVPVRPAGVGGGYRARQLNSTPRAPSPMLPDPDAVLAHNANAVAPTTIFSWGFHETPSEEAARRSDTLRRSLSSALRLGGGPLAVASSRMKPLMADGGLRGGKGGFAGPMSGVVKPKRAPTGRDLLQWTQANSVYAAEKQLGAPAAYRLHKMLLGVKTGVTEERPQAAAFAPSFTAAYGRTVASDSSLPSVEPDHVMPSLPGSQLPTPHVRKLVATTMRSSVRQREVRAKYPKRAVQTPPPRARQVMYVNSPVPTGSPFSVPVELSNSGGAPIIPSGVLSASQRDLRPSPEGGGWATLPTSASHHKLIANPGNDSAGLEYLERFVDLDLTSPTVLMRASTDSLATNQALMSQSLPSLPSASPAASPLASPSRRLPPQTLPSSTPQSPLAGSRRLSLPAAPPNHDLALVAGNSVMSVSVAAGTVGSFDDPSTDAGGDPAGEAAAIVGLERRLQHMYDISSRRAPLPPRPSTSSGREDADGDNPVEGGESLGAMDASASVRSVARHTPAGVVTPARQFQSMWRSHKASRHLHGVRSDGKGVLSVPPKRLGLVARPHVVRGPQ